VSVDSRRIAWWRRLAASIPRMWSECSGLALRVGAAVSPVVVVAVVGLLATASVGGAVPVISSLTPADATPKAFSVVWVSDEAVSSASVRIFAEPEGTTERTAELVQVLVSESFPPALDLGLVKVDVTEASPDTCFYIQTETQSATGTTLEPSAPPFVEVCTTTRTTREGPFGQPLTNDLLRHELTAPDGATPATGALVLLETPEVGGGALSAFVGDGYAEDQVVWTLNDVFAGDSGENVALAGGSPVRLRELRGRLCSDPTEQARTRYRKLPAHEEFASLGVSLSQVEPPELCFFVDADCNGTVEEADANRLFEGFDASAGECRFNPDLDVVADDRIDILDAQQVLNRLGEPAP